MHHKKEPGVYIFTNKVNGKKYVGESMNIHRRMSNYRHPQNNRPIERALLKYGLHNFNIEVIYYPYSDEEFLITTEKLLIREYDCLVPYGYNICSYGTSKVGIPVSSETRDKMSKVRTGKVQSLETKAKRSVALKGRVFSPATITKMAESQKGKKHSLERIEKRVRHLRGRIVSNETRTKLSIAHIGKTKSPEHIAKMSGENSSSAKAVSQFTLDGVFIRNYPTRTEASRDTNTNLTSICLCISGKQKKAGEYLWRNFNNEN